MKYDPSQVQILKDERGPYFLLTEPALKKPLIVRVDFEERQGIGLKSDGLARAVGYKKGHELFVLDATAGLCRDSYHLCCLGIRVLAIEANEMLFQVLSHYVEQLPTVKKLKLLKADAVEIMKDWSPTQTKPQVVYLDPMFPLKDKSAKSGKESELLKALAPVHQEHEEQQLFEAALKLAQQRVVVKRPKGAPYLKTKIEKYQKPQVEFSGKSIRYDVYITTI